MALTTIDDRGLKTPIDLLDSEKIRLGTGNDLQIYHDTNTYNYVQGANIIVGEGNSTIFWRATHNENSINSHHNGSTEIYYDNSKKLETASGGINVVGYVNVQSSGQIYIEDGGKLNVGTSNDLQIYHNNSGDANFIETGSQIIHIQSDSSIRLQKNTGSENMLIASADGAVNLYYDNSLKIQTKSYGVNMPDNSQLYFGTGDDLVIKHDGSHSSIVNATGDFIIKGDNTLYLRSNGIYLKNAAGSENFIDCSPNAEVSLFYDNSKKFETSSAGTTTTGNATFTGHIYQGDNDAHFFGDGNDLTISHDGSNSYIYDSGTGSLILRSSRVSFNDASNNENARIDSEGLKFNGDSAAVNGLNDYEEGTWTPTVAGSPTDLSVSGEYRKIGKMVSFNGFVSLTSHSNSSTTTIGGLPFSGMSGKTFSVTVGNYRYLNLDGGYNQFMIDMAGTTMTLREQGDNTNYQNISWDQISNDFQVYFSGVYYTP